jgi:phosphoserine aminotransferase
MFYRTFNPGPSQVSEAVKADVAVATQQNITSISHRSSAFREISKQAVAGLRQYFAVPADYHVLFTSSAIEAMELVIRNLVEKESFHFVNGHFSELFAAASEAFGKTALVDAVEWGEQNDFANVPIPPSSEIVTLTYNETSTGATCDNKTVRDLRKRIPTGLLVVDVTSVAGCLKLDIAAADVWLFSVQKGMGLPSGLGIMFISPQALARSRRPHHAGLFNFERMARQMEQYQTIHTPNILGIYLLAKQLERWNHSKAPSNQQETKAKAKLLQQFIETHDALDYFVRQPAARSQTTVCITAEPAIIAGLHEAAVEANLVLGSGYGKLKDHTCRIATFPALTRGDIQRLIEVLSPVVR